MWRNKYFMLFLVIVLTVGMLLLGLGPAAFAGDRSTSGYSDPDTNDPGNGGMGSETGPDRMQGDPGGYQYGGYYGRGGPSGASSGGEDASGTSYSWSGFGIPPELLPYYFEWLLRFLEDPAIQELIAAMPNVGEILELRLLLGQYSNTPGAFTDLMMDRMLYLMEEYGGVWTDWGPAGFAAVEALVWLSFTIGAAYVLWLATQWGIEEAYLNLRRDMERRRRPGYDPLMYDGDGP